MLLPPLSSDEYAHGAAHSVAPPLLDSSDYADDDFATARSAPHAGAPPPASVTNTWRGSLCFLEGFYAPGEPLGVEALRSAMRVVSRPPSTSLHLVDFWATTALTLRGLTRKRAASIGFDPEVASAAASVADALHVAAERMSVDHAEFTPDGWTITLTVTGFESRAAAAAAAADSLRSHDTQTMLQRAFGGFLCGSEDCLDVTVALAPPRVRAIALAKPLVGSPLAGAEEVGSPLDAHRRLLNGPHLASLITSAAT